MNLSNASKLFLKIETLDRWFWDTHSLVLKDANYYRRLLRKKIYLTVTCLDIIYVVGVLN